GKFYAGKATRPYVTVAVACRPGYEDVSISRDSLIVHPNAVDFIVMSNVKSTNPQTGKLRLRMPVAICSAGLVDGEPTIGAKAAKVNQVHRFFDFNELPTQDRQQFAMMTGPCTLVCPSSGTLEIRRYGGKIDFIMGHIRRIQSPLVIY